LQCYINLARLVFKTPTRFFGSIVQPRVSSIAETVEFPREQLDDLFLAVNEARHSNALMPGEHCRFCPLLLGCRAAERAALEAADADFDEIEDASSDRIPRLIALTQIAPVAAELAERARRALAAELDAGRAIPGFRIAQTLGRRKWRDPDEALQTLRQVFPDLRDRLCSVSLKSPAQIEKLVGPDALAELDLVERQGGQPVLVDASSRLPDRVCDEFSEC